jgi:hypothetical protein
VLLTPSLYDNLTIILETQNEITLMAALHETQKTNAKFQCYIIDLQALNILNEIYCNKLCFQLAHKEEKQDQLKGKLIGDGLPKMLTGDKFYKQVVEFTKWQKEQERLKATRQEEAVGYKTELAVWKEGKEQRNAKNKEQSEEFHIEVAAWDEWREKAKAKAKLHKFKKPKPKWGPLLKATPKPKQAIYVNKSGEEDTNVVGEEEGSESEVNDDKD